MADARTQLDLAWSAFQSASYSDAAYSTYLTSLLRIASSHPEIDHIVATYIAHTMFLESVEADATKEAITQYAGELENPALSGERRSRTWRAITKLFREL